MLPGPPADMAKGGAVLELTPEKDGDWWEIEALFDLCFAPGREALSSYRLREGVPPVAGLSAVVRDGGGILAGAIRFWPVVIGPAQALLLGPIAVHPTHQGEGLGGYMMRSTLDAARDKNWARVMLVGDAPYYARFGFARLTGIEMPPPTNPERILGLALRPGAWEGIAGKVTRAA